jgi:hypothetical protein
MAKTGKLSDETPYSSVANPNDISGVFDAIQAKLLARPP